MELIKSKITKKNFIKWFYNRPETFWLLLISFGFCIFGILFFLFGYYLHNEMLTDVLIIFIGMGVLVCSLTILAPHIAFSKSVGKKIRLSHLGIQVYTENILDFDYSIEKIRLIYIFRETIVFELKSHASITIYNTEEADVRHVLGLLSGTKVKVLKADSIFHIMLRKYKSIDT